MRRSSKKSSYKKRLGLRGQQGVAAIEMALMLPVLMLVLMGIIDFGRLMFTREVLANASREGSRQGIVLVTPPLSQTDIENVVSNALTNAGYDPSAATITVVGAGGGTGADLQVTVDYPFNFWVLSKLIPGMTDNLTLRADTIMKME